ncbi:zinc-binding dehydrogenase [Hypoxylon fragiforme]|uniref:zinc-binding dehydrogenase n=1 Tax=Hypoxylon fragiforme TaxID=63214 RepID=UPI0020C71876|nr:zinc-binding dehydrogenase [Hypoxylon fragiforme]KAI2611463.1 zinc-binding dehydrogenase [Hypoxylon fragiforme]
MKALVTLPEHTASVQDLPTPQPTSSDEILVRVHYAAQNPTDWKSMRNAPAGRIVGCDFAGTVEKASPSSSSSSWQPGQRVAGWVHGLSGDPIRGAFAEYLVTEASLVYGIPDSVSYADAAVVPLAFATAVQALFSRLRLPEPLPGSQLAKQKGDNPIYFLVSGGTTSVGGYAIQLAKLSGATVIATGSPRNHAYLKSLGADFTVDYKDAHWPEQVRELTHDSLGLALDCISENGTVEAVVDALSTSKGGHAVTLLAVKELREKIKAEKPKVKLESTIAYTVFGRPIDYGDFDNWGGPTPSDKAFWEKYLAILPELLSSGTIKPNRVREFGTIEDILTGFKEQEAGRVNAEKLVYKIITQ